MTYILCSACRGVGEGTATTAMAVPFVGTPKLSGHQFPKLKKRERRKNKENRKKEDRQRQRDKERVSEIQRQKKDWKN